MRRQCDLSKVVKRNQQMRLQLRLHRQRHSMRRWVRKKLTSLISYSQFGFKVTPNISFFQKWNTCKASWCRPGLSRAEPRQRVLCFRQRWPLALVGKIIQPIPVYNKGCYTFAWLLHNCACIAMWTRIHCLVHWSIPIVFLHLEINSTLWFELYMFHPRCLFADIRIHFVTKMHWFVFTRNDKGAKGERWGVG